MPIRRRLTRAQGLTEYVVIVGLIALVLAIAVNLLRGRVEAAYTSGAEALLTQVNGEELPLPPKTPGNPYEWNDAAQRWYDPATRAFVSFSQIAPYEANPRRYLN